MKENILKYLSIVGFANSTDLSNCKQLEDELNE